MAGRGATHEERVEWLLDQIRINTLIVALVFTLALIGAVIALAGR